MEILLAIVAWFVAMWLALGAPSNPLTAGWGVIFIPVFSLPTVFLLFLADRVATWLKPDRMSYFLFFGICALAIFLLVAGLIWINRAPVAPGHSAPVGIYPHLIVSTLAAWLAYALGVAVFRK